VLSGPVSCFIAFSLHVFKCYTFYVAVLFQYSSMYDFVWCLEFVHVVFLCTVMCHCLAWYHNTFTLLDLFVQFLLTCAEHLPHKIPLYGTLVEISFLSWTVMTSVILFPACFNILLWMCMHECHVYIKCSSSH